LKSQAISRLPSSTIMTNTDIIISTFISILPLGFLIPETWLKCWDVWWVYTRIEENIWKIYVCDLKDWNIDFYKHHEIAHKIWNEVLSEKQKKEYDKYYRKANKFTSTEGQLNIEEDFCDNYASLKTNTKQELDIRKRIFFIKKLTKNIKVIIK
jgi:hypothetical protein